MSVEKSDVFRARFDRNKIPPARGINDKGSGRFGDQIISSANAGIAARAENKSSTNFRLITRELGAKIEIGSTVPGIFQTFSTP
jgi:hypothetical protein